MTAMMRLSIMGGVMIALTGAMPAPRADAAPGQIAPAFATAPEPVGEAAARAALARMGLPVRHIALHMATSPESYFQVRARAGRATVTASSPVALVRGTYAYLNEAGLASVSWEGIRVAAGRLPDSPGQRIVSPFALRAYMNTCTFGYTTPWWNWARWEREIDWMATNGIDTPLAMEGQDHVWRALWREAGLSDAEVAGSMSAPPFLPWQRMGNIEGYRAPLSAGWIEKKHQLQRRILARMRALGMKPVLPAFAGYVPKAFADRHPEARIYRMRQWEGFPGTYWLDPSDPLFARLAARFMRLYADTYGAGDYYLADAFNEMVPPIAEDGSDARAATYGDGNANSAATRAAQLPAGVRHERLAAYGERLYTSIRAAAPQATWVMQGWLFGADKQFWTPDSIAAFLSRVPDDRMMILDIGNDRYPGIWHDTSAFNGKSWVFGYVHNYGGSNPVYGDLDFYRTDMAAMLADKGRGHVAGFGVFPEGLHSNSIVYANSYDLAWSNGGASTADWLHRHARARYGQVTPAVDAAWRQLADGAYRTRYWTPRWWENKAGAYLFLKRPGDGADRYPASPGDPEALRAGIDALVAQAGVIGREPLYRYDVVDMTRHYVMLAIDDQVKRAVVAYRAGDLAGGDRAVATMTRLARATDHLLGNQQETLASWVDDARAYADTPAEARAFTVDAKAQVSIWGGEGHLADYASKAWQGMVADFYLPRWTRFLAAQRAAAVSRRPFDAAAATRDVATWEHRWVKDGRIAPRQRPADPVAEVRALLAAVDAA